MNEMNEIGPRLRELREASDYTVERLAAELKVDPDVYRGYEQDGKDIPISLISVSYTHLSGRPSPGPSSPIRSSSWPTSPPAPWTPVPPGKMCIRDRW